MSKFRIVPAINRDAKEGYRVEKKKLFSWKTWGVRRYGVGGSCMEKKWFDTAVEAYEWIRERYGTTAEIVEWCGS